MSEEKTTFENPEWCPHKDCKTLGQDGCVCAGRLPESTEHHEYKGVNTHRYCLSNADSRDKPWVFDLMVNVSDIMQFVLAFNRILKDLGKMTYQSVGQEYFDAMEALEEKRKGRTE